MYTMDINSQNYKFIIIKQSQFVVISLEAMKDCQQTVGSRDKQAAGINTNMNKYVSYNWPTNIISILSLEVCQTCREYGLTQLTDSETT